MLFEKYLQQYSAFLHRRNPQFMIITGVICTLLLGWLDNLFGASISLEFFYLLPVAFVAWFVGRKSGLLLAVLCASFWLATKMEYNESFSFFFQQLWNGLTAFAFFATVVLLLVKLRTLLEEAQDLSRTDYLTGAMNGRAFDEMVSLEILRQRRYGQTMTIAYLDLDNFKAINDTFGHTIGDELLKEVAATINGTLRRTDLVARLGGDEFAILLPETAMAAATTAMAKVQNNLLTRMQERDWPVTFSIGVLTCEAPIQTPTEMVSLADKLMYAVKQAGKNALRHAVYQGEHMPGNGPLLVPVGA